jgi:hypothetical protein
MTTSTPKKRTVKKAIASTEPKKAAAGVKKAARSVAAKKATPAATSTRSKTHVTSRATTRGTTPKTVKVSKPAKTSKAAKRPAGVTKCVAEPHECFWINNGAVVKDLHELALEMQRMSDEQFLHHVRSDQNDFARWVAEVFGEDALARKLARARSRDGARRVVVAHVSLRG